MQISLGIHMGGSGKKLINHPDRPLSDTLYELECIIETVHSLHVNPRDFFELFLQRVKYVLIVFYDDDLRDIHDLAKFWKVLFFVAIFTFLDDPYRFFNTKKSIHLTGSRFFEILVVFPVVGRFFLPVFTELGIARDMIHALVIREDTDHLVVDFTTIVE